MTAPAQGLMLWTVEYGPGPRLPKTDTDQSKKEERSKKEESEDDEA